MGGDAYVTVEGGPGVVKEAKLAVDRGALVVPLIRSGGASSGLFDFPPTLLEKPAFAEIGDWDLLTDELAPPTASAKAVARIIAARLGLPIPARPSQPPRVSQLMTPQPSQASQL